jgi:hypothetical protein
MRRKVDEFSLCVDFERFGYLILSLFLRHELTFGPWPVLTSRVCRDRRRETG